MTPVPTFLVPMFFFFSTQVWRSHFHPTHLAKPPCHFQPFQGCSILNLSNSCFVPLQEFNFRSKLLDGSCCEGTFNAHFQCVSANFRFFWRYGKECVCFFIKLVSIPGFVHCKSPIFEVAKVCFYPLCFVFVSSGPQRKISNNFFEHFSTITLPETNSRRTWKWMLGIRLFPFGIAYFQGRLLLVFWDCIYFYTIQRCSFPEKNGMTPTDCCTDLPSILHL